MTFTDSSSLLAVIDQHVRDGDEAALIEYVVGLPADAIPELLWRLQERRRMLDRLEDVLEARAKATGLKEWTAPTGEAFTFGTGRKRVVSAPRKLHGALLDAIVNAVGPDVHATANGHGDHPHLRALRAAFEEQEPKVRLKEFDVFLSLNPAYALAAEAYVTWEESSSQSHLKPKYVKP